MSPLEQELYDPSSRNPDQADLATLVCDRCTEPGNHIGHIVAGEFDHASFKPARPEDAICDEGHLMRMAEWGDFPDDTPEIEGEGYTLLVDDRDGKFRGVTTSDPVLEHLQTKYGWKVILGASNIILMRDGGARAIYHSGHEPTGVVHVIVA